jgi:PKD repeat protein
VGVKVFMKKMSWMFLVAFCILVSNIVMASPSDFDGKGISDIYNSNPPIADFTYSPSYPTTQDVIQFTDTSTNGTSDIISWSWEFGDGEISNLQNPKYQYGDDGFYEVTLTVMDEGGLEDDETNYITVSNVPPVANFTYTPLYPSTGDVVHFIDLSIDIDGDIVAWLWDFGDGEMSTLENPEHKYENKGEFPVILKVEDDDEEFAVDTILFIYGANLEADANGPYLGNVDEIVDFNGSGSYDTDDEIVAYVWDFGDGNTGTGVNPSHIYNEVGMYTVILTIENDEGYTANDTTSAIIIDYDNNPPDKPTINGPSKGKSGEEYTYYASTTDPDGDNVSYLFNWGNNITSFIMGPYPSGFECNASTIWFEGGIYNITVKAIDIYGAESEWSDPFEIIMPKIYIHNPIQELLMKIMKCFSFFEIILNQIV